MIELAISIFIIFLGYVFGRVSERRHYVSIKQRESQFHNKPGISGQLVPDEEIAVSTLAVGNVVISIDSFKKFMAGFVNFFGGEMTSYSSLIDRARREAILRMKESAPSADAYLNVKIDTVSLSQGNNSIGSVEVFCYATAVKFKSKGT